MRIKELRENHKKTQTQIAQILDMPQSTYQHYENYRSVPSIDNLIKLADYYKVSLDYLVGRKFNHEVGSLKKEEVDYVNALLKLNEQNRIKILGYAITLLAEQE